MSASAEGHRYDHDGMHRHHHEYGPTGRAIWWEYADQFGGDLTEHTHADRASVEGLPDGICDITGARHPDLVSRKDVAALRDTGPCPDSDPWPDLDGPGRDDQGYWLGGMGTPDTGPRPDSGIDGLAGHIRESLDANNAFEYDDPINGVMTGFDGNKDVLAEAIAADLARLATPRTEPGE